MSEYFGQHEEDRVIEKYIGDKKEGKYIDIGAGEPVLYSNTYRFYLKGWYGLTVEPHPHYAQMWRDTRPRDRYIQAAITDYNGEVEMSSTATVGSFIGDDYKFNLKKELYRVPCLTLNKLLEENEEYRDCDFVSIDVETNEDKVLAGCDFEKFRPQLIVIEYQMRYVDYRHKWEHLISPYYGMKESVLNNGFYLRKN